MQLSNVVRGDHKNAEGVAVFFEKKFFISQCHDVLARQLIFSINYIMYMPKYIPGFIYYFTFPFQIIFSISKKSMHPLEVQC